MSLVNQFAAKLFPLQRYYKKLGNYEGDTFDVCFALDRGWNTLNEHIPVLYYIREHFPERHILSLVLENNTVEMIQEHPEKWERLKEVSDVIIYNDFSYFESDNKLVQSLKRLRLSLYKKAIITQQAACLDSLLKGKHITSVLFEDWREAGVVTTYLSTRYPEGATRYIVHTPVAFQLVGPTPKIEKYEPTSFYTAVNRPEYDAYEKVYHQKTILVGSAQHDPWWLERIASTTPKAYHGRDIYICFSMVTDSRFPKDLKREMRKFFEANQQYTYVFNFHPRDQRKDKQHFLENYVPAGCDYVITTDSIYDVCQNVRCVIQAGASTSGGDILLSHGKMVEFYGRLPESHRKSMYLCDDGEYGYFLRWKKCVPYASDAETLTRLVDQILHHDLWSEYEERFWQYVPKENHACRDIANLLLEGHL